KDKKERQFASFHDSMFYFARAFGLDTKDMIVLQEKPDDDVSPGRITALKKKGLEKNVRVIAVEPQYASKQSLATTLDSDRDMKGNGAMTVELDALETAAPEDLTRDWYVRKMRGNIDALAKKLR